MNGRPAVILYTCKAVKKGQSLLYDYGAGLNKAKYDTSNYEWLIIRYLLSIYWVYKIC